MPRLAPAVACLAALLEAAAGQAAGPPAGRWKLRFTEDGQPVTFLLALSEADGKWVGDFIGSSARLQREPQVTAVRVAGDAVGFTLAVGGREFVSFDGLLAKGGKKISGSMSQFGGPLKLTDLYPSQLKRVDDPADLAREDVAQLDGGAELFDAGFAVLGQAAAKKLPAEEARGVADKLAKAAGGYGPRWERTVAVRLATTLADQPGYADAAVAQARRAERMLGDDAPPAVQMEVIDTLARILGKAGKADEAKKYAGLAAKLEARDYAEFAKTGLGFAPEPAKGRKGKGDRVAVVEVITSAEAGPAAAVELACQGLTRAFPPAEAVVLAYHVNIPQAPDPLTGPDGMERVGYYADQVRGVPTVLVNGKPGPRGGGPAAAAKDKFADLRDLVEKAAEVPAPVKLALSVTAAGDKGYTAKATVSDLEAPGEKMALRFVLAEERVRFAGGSGVRYHAHVVRALPGGPKGFPLLKKSQEQTVAVDPAEVRTRLTKYLDDFARSEADFPRPDRPLALANLKLVALVQNDATNEILQAVQVDLK